MRQFPFVLYRLNRVTTLAKLVAMINLFFDTLNHKLDIKGESAVK